ncbi:KamA family radical SAM protein [Desulfonatronospira sp.]|uniref:KamA family radical SAM protein n=1 Tax=Desulfonatronospira sp. TaxID=1962951 RepID=UPI0025C5C8F6|nr:KamA family radical SAM protein [Desulfonatronospira sp.]
MQYNEPLDDYTIELLNHLYSVGPAKDQWGYSVRVSEMLAKAESHDSVQDIVDIFLFLKKLRLEKGLSPAGLGLQWEQAVGLALRHQSIDEHGVSLGGRVDRAMAIVEEAGVRVDGYLKARDKEAASGIQLWDGIQENHARIRRVLGMSMQEWDSFAGQLKYAIESPETLEKILNLPRGALDEVSRVTREYRMRMTPYYAGLIMPERLDDPVLLQSVPTGEMVDNAGIEIPPVAADHSPARLIDQFYPRVVTIKATNMCAMYCTHCLRIAHIGRKDRIYPQKAYAEALDYIRNDSRIRDVLITGGDAFMLPNNVLKNILAELDRIEHVRIKRLGTRIPVTTPQRVDGELLDILESSNDIKPVRVVTQINTAQEITPVSREAFKQISKRVFAVLNQAVLLKGINDTFVKMVCLCETIQEAYVRPYYIFNCSYRNPQFTHLRVPVEKGRDIVEAMYGNISGDAVPRYIATAGGKIPLHRSNVLRRTKDSIVLQKPWSAEEVSYPDADPVMYADSLAGLKKYSQKVSI